MKKQGLSGVNVLVLGEPTDQLSWVGCDATWVSSPGWCIGTAYLLSALRFGLFRGSPAQLLSALRCWPELAGPLDVVARCPPAPSAAPLVPQEPALGQLALMGKELSRRL